MTHKKDDESFHMMLLIEYHLEHHLEHHHLSHKGFTDSFIEGLTLFSLA